MLLKNKNSAKGGIRANAVCDTLNEKSEHEIRTIENLQQTYDYKMAR